MCEHDLDADPYEALDAAVGRFIARTRGRQGFTKAMGAGRVGFAHLVLLARTAEAVQESGAQLDQLRLLRKAAPCRSANAGVAERDRGGMAHSRSPATRIA